MAGAMMILTAKWMKPGVYNVEELDPQPFLKVISDYGLPLREEFDDKTPKMFSL